MRFESNLCVKILNSIFCCKNWKTAITLVNNSSKALCYVLHLEPMTLECKRMAAMTTSTTYAPRGRRYWMAVFDLQPNNIYNIYCSVYIDAGETCVLEDEDVSVAKISDDMSKVKLTEQLEDLLFDNQRMIDTAQHLMYFHGNVITCKASKYNMCDKHLKIQ